MRILNRDIQLRALLANICDEAGFILFLFMLKYICSNLRQITDDAVL